MAHWHEGAIMRKGLFTAEGLEGTFPGCYKVDEAGQPVGDKGGYYVAFTDETLAAMGCADIVPDPIGVGWLLVDLDAWERWQAATKTRQGSAWMEDYDRLMETSERLPRQERETMEVPNSGQPGALVWVSAVLNFIHSPGFSLVTE